MEVQSQPRQIVRENLSGRNLSQKNRAGGVAQCVVPEFKPCTAKKKKKKKKKKNKKKKKF
jgi:hypothetical protein